MASVHSRIGIVNQDAVSSADSTSLARFRTLFTSEVLALLDNKCIMKGMHRTRNITSGKAASFPLLGRTDAGYHVPGTEITGNLIKHADKIITIDAKLFSAVEIYDLDEAMSEFSVRSKYVDRCASAMAKHYDINVLRQACIAAETASPLELHDHATNTEPGGSVVEMAGAAGAVPTAAALAEGIFAAAETLETKNLDPSQATCILRPQQYYDLVQEKDLLNKDWGGRGEYATASIPMVAGIPIKVSQHLPKDPVAGTFGNKYDHDFSNTFGLVMLPDAVATLTLMGLKTESERRQSYQDWQFIMTQAIGHGVLDPACAITLKNASTDTSASVTTV